MSEYNKNRCQVCNKNSEHLKRLNHMKMCPSCYDKELGRQDFFAEAPFTMGGMPVPM